MLQCAAVCCSVLQCVAACCSVLQCVAVYCSVLQCVAVCCVLQFRQCIERLLMQRIQRIHQGHRCEPPQSLHRLLRVCVGRGVMSFDASVLSSVVCQCVNVSCCVEYRLQQTATDCNRLQQTANHCSRLIHTATHCTRPTRTATHCST